MKVQGRQAEWGIVRSSHVNTGGVGMIFQLVAGWKTCNPMHMDLTRFNGIIDDAYTPLKNLTILSKMDNQEPRLVVTLGLKGHSCFAGRTGDEVLFNEGHTTITSFISSMGERHYEANKPVNQLRFSISKQWIERYFGENKSARLFDKKETQLLSHRPISAQGIMSAWHLIACNLAQDLRLLFMHGQAMIILAAELAHLF
jgi:AraC family transcriptional regulator, transcriptional activator of the genes for pyochelin and ferripyochelin receptors